MSTGCKLQGYVVHSFRMQLAQELHAPRSPSADKTADLMEFPPCFAEDSQDLALELPWFPSCMTVALFMPKTWLSQEAGCVLQEVRFCRGWFFCAVKSCVAVFDHRGPKRATSW